MPLPPGRTVGAVSLRARARGGSGAMSANHVEHAASSLISYGAKVDKCEHESDAASRLTEFASTDDVTRCWSWPRTTRGRRELVASRAPPRPPPGLGSVCLVLSDAAALTPRVRQQTRNRHVTGVTPTTPTSSSSPGTRRARRCTRHCAVSRARRRERCEPPRGGAAQTSHPERRRLQPHNDEERWREKIRPLRVRRVVQGARRERAPDARQLRT